MSQVAPAAADRTHVEPSKNDSNTPESAEATVATNATLKSAVKYDDGGLAIVRIKPLGAGGGGVEESSASGRAGLLQSEKGIEVIGCARKKLFRCVYRFTYSISVYFQGA